MAWKIIWLVLFSLVSLAACTGTPRLVTEEMPGKPGASGRSGVEAVPAIQPESGLPSGQEAEGGKLVRLFKDPSTLDPHISTDSTSAQIIVELYGGLVTINQKLEPVPDLAKTWDVSLDGTVFTFHLREEAVFHDGRPVTAEDVRWSLERATSPLTGSPVVEQYLGDIVGAKDKINGDSQSISGLKVIDGHTLEITIDAPKTYFLVKLTHPTGFVLDRHNVEANPKNWFRQPNGTGPFKMERYDAGKTLLLARNEDYHLGPSKLKEVEMILSEGTAMLMYVEDKIQIAGVGLAELDQVLDTKNPLNAELKRFPKKFSVQYIGLNVDEPPLDDPKVRQALNLAIDKKELATIVLGGQVVPAKGILPPGFPGYDSSMTGYEFDPERARRLLAESKYGDDLENIAPIVLNISARVGSAVSLDMDVVTQMWEKNLGLNVDIKTTEGANFLSDLRNGSFQMFGIGWTADYLDPENLLDISFQSESGGNHTNYDSPRVDALLLEARIETNETVRYGLYNQAERLILEDAPWVPLWYSGERYFLVKPNVRDYSQTPFVIPRLRYVYLSDQ